jgi:hypothetical protein
MAIRFRLARSISVVAVVLVAPTTGGTGAAAAPDACALLSTSQVSAALGVTVGPGRATLPGACQWDQPGKPGERLWKVSVNFANKDRWKVATTTSQPGVTITPVAGLGDDAFYYTRGTDLTTLSVKKGDTAVVIRVWGGVRPVPDLEAKEKALAQQMLPNL